VTTTDNDRADPIAALAPAADPARAGAEAAQRTITAQAAAGVSTERMDAHAQDTAAWLFSEATGTGGEAFARGYDGTAQSLVAELREAEHPLPQPGTPHPSPQLAAKGWEVSPHGAGVYIRRQADAHADRELEAG
jgi:hypothetical protein